VTSVCEESRGCRASGGGGASGGADDDEAVAMVCWRCEREAVGVCGSEV
jgi:hypothetical protein